MKRASPLVLLALVAVACLFGLVRTDMKAESTAPKGDIKFSHKLHVTDQGVDCQTCHPSVDTSRAASDKNLPTMEICGSCHEVEDEKNCGQCHRSPDNPQPLPNPERSIQFNHARHISDKVACIACHEGIGRADSLAASHIPKMALCFGCHDGTRAPEKCNLCHGQKITLSDIHPADWRHQHADQASVRREWCGQCHRSEKFCLDCHRGDNLRGNIHDLNFVYTHGLDASLKEADCTRCHDRKTFCDDCHRNRSRMPLGHSSVAWVNDHGAAARRDVESCASCHDVADPTCGRTGCHNDFDGIRGTNPPIHPRARSDFDSEGPWHRDDSYYCFDCHRKEIRGSGFCGYCHQ